MISIDKSEFYQPEDVSSAFPSALPPVLERDDEVRLATQYKVTRDPRLARQLIEGHLRLVFKIARECCWQPALLPDLVQEGCVGLIKAVSKYDPARNVRLSTYASWWIRAQVYQYIMANARIMRVATTFAQRKLFFSLKREIAKLERENRATDPKALSEHLGVSERAVREMTSRLAARDVRIDAAGAALVDDNLRTSELNPHDALEAEDLRAAVRRKLETLGHKFEARELVILEERLCADKPITLQEVGRRFGLSRERARQIECRLKARLRPHFEGLRDPSDLQAA